MTPQEFRDTIRELGLSQRALARHLGLNKSTVNRWATGETPVPQYAVAWIEAWGDLRRIMQPLEALFTPRT
jgi:transcriptional regulator with XRE-family HTH domain